MESTSLIMEVIDIARELFEGREVRILGTIEEPLFLAKDIGKLLGLSKITQNFSSCDIATPQYIRYVMYTGNKGQRKMVALTEVGLYTALFRSNKPEARRFQEWACNLIKEIRKRAMNNKDADNKKQVQKPETTIQSTEPVIEYPDMDINDYTDAPCIYLLHVKDNDYKFGYSGEIDDRQSNHIRQFKSLGCDPYIVKLWKCDTMSIMKSVEAKIKRLADHIGIRVKKYGQTEIITTNNIEYIIAMIDKYVSEQNMICANTMKLKLVELEIRNKQEDNENLRLQIQLLTLQNSIANPAVAHIQPTIIAPPATHQSVIPIVNKPISRTILPAAVNNNANIIDEPLAAETSDSSDDEQISQEIAVVSDQQSPGPIACALADNKPINTVVAVVNNQPATNSITDNLASKTPSQRQQATVEWVKANPPLSREVTTVYYKRYTDAIKKPLANKSFEPIAKKILGRDPMKVASNKRRW